MHEAPRRRSTALQAFKVRPAVTWPLNPLSDCTHTALIFAPSSFSDDTDDGVSPPHERADDLQRCACPLPPYIASDATPSVAHASCCATVQSATDFSCSVRRRRTTTFCMHSACRRGSSEQRLRRTHRTRGRYRGSRNQQQGCSGGRQCGLGIFVHARWDPSSFDFPKAISDPAAALLLWLYVQNAAAALG
ncbi:hypothetical protein BC628DRAFT_1358235 [Trametes gibbosa]|nr:hypothetical protein BC628DRAFT_1358235 [Trametes gibbosa]